MLGAVIWDKKTNEVLFEEDKQLQLNTKQMDSNCFDIEFYEEITIDENYIKDNREFMVQLTVSSTGEKNVDLKSMEYLFTVKEVRGLDTP